MDTFFRGGETIIIKRTSETGELDDFGLPIISTSSITVKNCLIQFGSTSEPIDINRNAEDSSLTLYLPKNTIIQDDDVFEIRQTTFVKNGMVHDWESPFDDFETGVVVQVRRRHG